MKYIMAISNFYVRLGLSTWIAFRCFVNAFKNIWRINPKAGDTVKIHFHWDIT